MHHRIQLRKQLHEFEMVKGADIMEHLIGLNDVGDTISEDEKLVILMGSFPSEFDVILIIIENKPGVDIMDAKEMLYRESEKMKEHEQVEAALRTSGSDQKNVFIASSQTSRKGD